MSGNGGQLGSGFLHAGNGISDLFNASGSAVDLIGLLGCAARDLLDGIGYTVCIFGDL